MRARERRPMDVSRAAAPTFGSGHCRLQAGGQMSALKVAGLGAYSTAIGWAHCDPRFPAVCGMARSADVDEYGTAVSFPISYHI